MTEPNVPADPWAHYAEPDRDLAQRYADVCGDRDRLRREFAVLREVETDLAGRLGHAEDRLAAVRRMLGVYWPISSAQVVTHTDECHRWHVPCLTERLRRVMDGEDTDG